MRASKRSVSRAQSWQTPSLSLMEKIPFSDLSAAGGLGEAFQVVQIQVETLDLKIKSCEVFYLGLNGRPFREVVAIEKGEKVIHT